MTVSRGLDGVTVKTAAVVGIQAATAVMIQGVRAASKTFSHLSTSGEKGPNTASSDRPNRAYRMRARAGSGPGAASARKALPARPGEPEKGPKGAPRPRDSACYFERASRLRLARQCRARRSRANSCVEQGRSRRRKRGRRRMRAGPGAHTDAGAEGDRGRSHGRMRTRGGGGRTTGRSRLCRHERSEPPPHRRAYRTTTVTRAFA